MKISTSQERLIQLFDSDPRNDTAIADALGVSKQTVSMWRHGTRSPKKSVLIHISEVYGVSIEWLMGFDVEKTGAKTAKPIVIQNMKQFGHLLQYMTQEEYDFVVAAFDKARERMREKGIEP